MKTAGAWPACRGIGCKLLWVVRLVWLAELFLVTLVLVLLVGLVLE